MHLQLRMVACIGPPLLCIVLSHAFCMDALCLRNEGGQVRQAVVSAPDSGNELSSIMGRVNQARKVS